MDASKLSAWKAKNMSLVGRTTLIKFMLLAIPTYVMQSERLPRSVCDELDKMSRGFLWGEHQGNQKWHTIA